MSSRRDFLIGSSTLMAIGSVSGVATRAHAAGVGSQDAAVRTGIVITRSDDVIADNFSAAMQYRGLHAVTLQGDPVRQWQARVVPLLEQGGHMLYGLTDWSDFQLLRGLAAELRLRVRQDMVHERSSLENEAGVVSLASALLDAEASAQASRAASHRPVLISWVLG